MLQPKVYAKKYILHICIITITDFNHFICNISFNFFQNEQEARSIILKQLSSNKFRQLEFYWWCWKTCESLSITKSSLIRQKGDHQNGCYKKAKHTKFYGKRTFLIHWYAHARVRIREWEMFVFHKIEKIKISNLPKYIHKQ